MIEYDDDGFELTYHVPGDSRALDFTDGAGRRREGRSQSEAEERHSESAI